MSTGTHAWIEHYYNHPMWQHNRLPCRAIASEVKIWFHVLDSNFDLRIQYFFTTTIHCMQTTAIIQRHSKQLTLCYDKLSTKEENKKDEMSSSTLRRQNSQKVKMTIFHNDRIKITPTSQRPSVTPQHCAVTPPDYTHKQTHSPTSEEQPFIALNDEPSFVADYDRLQSNS